MEKGSIIKFAQLSNSPRVFGPRDLWDAVEKGDAERVKLSLDAYEVKHCTITSNEGTINIELSPLLSANHDYGRGKTLLQLAAKMGHTDIIKILLDKDANIDVADHDHKKCALHYAAENEWYDIVLLLAYYGADQSIKDYIGRTPYYYGNTRIRFIFDSINSHMCFKHQCDVLPSGTTGPQDLNHKHV